MPSLYHFCISNLPNIRHFSDGSQSLCLLEWLHITKIFLHAKNQPSSSKTDHFMVKWNFGWLADISEGLIPTVSRGHMLTDNFQFMKQKCYFLRGVAECRHAVTPLSSYSIITTLQGFQKRYITLLYLKGLKRYQQKCKWKVRFTKESGVKCRHLNFESW